MNQDADRTKLSAGLDDGGFDIVRPAYVSRDRKRRSALVRDFASEFIEEIRSARDQGDAKTLAGKPPRQRCAQSWPDTRDDSSAIFQTGLTYANSR